MGTQETDLLPIQSRRLGHNHLRDEFVEHVDLRNPDIRAAYWTHTHEHEIVEPALSVLVLIILFRYSHAVLLG